MHSALVIVTRTASDWPREREDQNRRWQAFMHKLPPEKARERLDDATWLVDLADGAGELAGILSAATEFDYPHRVLFFAEEPRWVRSKPRA
jgi:hypothetical protein